MPTVINYLHKCVSTRLPHLGTRKFKDFSKVFSKTFVTFPWFLMMKVSKPFKTFVSRFLWSTYSGPQLTYTQHSQQNATHVK